MKHRFLRCFSAIHYAVVIPWLAARLGSAQPLVPKTQAKPVCVNPCPGFLCACDLLLAFQTLRHKPASRPFAPLRRRLAALPKLKQSASAKRTKSFGGTNWPVILPHIFALAPPKPKNFILKPRDRVSGSGFFGFFGIVHAPGRNRGFTIFEGVLAVLEVM